MAGPMAIPGVYIGGIAVISSCMLECWDLPYEVVTYNTNTVSRDYDSVNRLNVVNARKFFGNAWDLVKLVGRKKPGIVHFHTSRHMALMKDLVLAEMLRLLGCKVVGHIHHASYPTLLVGESRWLRRVQIKLLTFVFDRIILMSESIKQELTAELGPAALTKFNARAVVIYNFTVLIDGPKKRSPGKAKLFFIGNVGRLKGIFDLLQAVARLRSNGATGFELVLAGPFDSPAEGQRIMQTIRECGLETIVQLTGAVSGAAKDELFRTADIFVLPSYGEGVPISMLEAMAYGLPVIATAVGGVPEVLEEGKAGFLIRPGDVEALAETLTLLIGSPDLRVQMGQCGRARVEERHSSRVFLRQLREVYDGLESTTLGHLAAHIGSTS